MEVMLVCKVAPVTVLLSVRAQLGLTRHIVIFAHVELANWAG